MCQFGWAELHFPEFSCINFRFLPPSLSCFWWRQATRESPGRGEGQKGNNCHFVALTHCCYCRTCNCFAYRSSSLTVSDFWAMCAYLPLSLRSPRQRQQNVFQFILEGFQFGFVGSSLPSISLILHPSSLLDYLAGGCPLRASDTEKETFTETS